MHNNDKVNPFSPRGNKYGPAFIDVWLIVVLPLQSNHNHVIVYRERLPIAIEI